MSHMFETRSQSWQDAGLARQLTRGAVKKARIEALLLLVLLAGVLAAYAERRPLFGATFDTPVSIIAAAALVAIGWQFARDVGRALAPLFYRRLDPATAGTVGFLVRLIFILADHDPGAARRRAHAAPARPRRGVHRRRPRSRRPADDRQPVRGRRPAERQAVSRR